MANIIYVYNKHTGFNEMVFSMDAKYEYDNPDWAELEYDEKPFEDWKEQGGVLQVKDNVVYHITE